MEIKLVDWKGNVYSTRDIDLNKVATIKIEVKGSGESVRIVYINYDEEELNTGVRELCDGLVYRSYKIYDFRKDNNILFDKDFINRKTCYSYSPLERR